MVEEGHRATRTKMLQDRNRRRYIETNIQEFTKVTWQRNCMSSNPKSRFLHNEGKRLANQPQVQGSIPEI